MSVVADPLDDLRAAVLAKADGRVPMPVIPSTVPLTEKAIDGKEIGAHAPDLPGEDAHWRLTRASLELRLRDELGISAWGAEEAARRIVACALLEGWGVTDPAEVAACLHTSCATIDRDATLAKRLGTP